MAGKTVYLLTGLPGSGKTSLIKQALAGFPGRAGGFYTEEIRSHGVRQGFQIVSLEGERATLAHIQTRSPFHVGKYGVDVGVLEQVGVAALEKAIRQDDLVVIDEIGRMELFSEAFRQTVAKALEGGKRVLGTIMLRPHPWADGVKLKPQVHLLTVTRHNQGEVLEEVRRWLTSVGPGC